MNEEAIKRAKSLAEAEFPLPKVDLFDRLLLCIYVPIFLSIFFVFEILERLAHCFGKQALLRCIALMNSSFYHCLKLNGTKVAISWDFTLDKDKSYFVFSNHQSMYDMPILSEIFKSHNPRFIAKKEMGRGLPAISYNLKYAGHAMIDRKDPRQAIPEIKRFAKLIEDEKSLGVIFPEGTRARKGALKAFKTKGALNLISVATNSYIIPVTIENTWKLSARMSTLMPRNTTVHVIVGEAIPPGSLGQEEIVERAYREIKKNLERLRAGAASNS